MTIYGENDDQFRPRPTAAALIATTLSQALIAAALTSLALSVVMAVVANLRTWRTDWLLFAPFADDPLLASLTPSNDALSLASLTAGAATLCLAVILANFWPTDQKLSVRLFVYTFAIALLAFGVLPLAFEPARFKLFDAVPTVISAVFTGLVTAWLIMRVETRAVEMMGAFFTTTTPMQRVRIWSLRVPLGFGIVGAIAWLNGDRPLAYAAGVAIVVTLFENLARYPAAKFEQVSGPYLREEAAALPIVAIVLIAASVWAFGSDALKRPGNAIVASGKGVEMIRVSEITRAAEAKKKEEQEEPKIQIYWTKDKKREK